MRRKKKTSLPRVTLMAFNRKDLLAFCESVEALRLLVEDLRAVQRDLFAAAGSVTRKATRRKNESEGGPTSV